jgi:fluoroacetyl-CoA thioesterase
MKPGLKVGDVAEVFVTVDEKASASLLGGPVHPLYGTAGMIAHMEWAARQHILPYLEEGEDGVGYHVDVTHLKPAPLGAEIRIHSRVTNVQPRRVTSRVEAWWGEQKVGEGNLTQALVSREKLYACIKQPADVVSAELADIQNKNCFGLQILKWEHELSACTRYDEWLIVKVAFASQTHEGPFLLRYELEEWQQACDALLAGKQDSYQSDFLESVLAVQMQRVSDHFSLALTLTTPETMLTSKLQLNVTPETLKQFAQRLAQQLELFPSQL